MVCLVLLSIWYLIGSTCASDPPPTMIGHIYNRMAYNSTDSPLVQLTIKNKFVCAAQCAHQFPACNTAVFNTNIMPQCWLYGQPVRQSDLIDSISTVVYDFQENKFRVTTSTTSTSTTSSTTTAPSTSTTTTTSSTSTTTTTITTSTSTSTSSTSATTVTTTTTVTFPYSGILFNLSLPSLPSGWNLCYSAPYPASLNPAVIATILTLCYRDNLLLGCRPVGSTALTVAAMGSRSDVLYDCGSTLNCTHVANGVGWYFSDSYSWGFVDGVDTVLRNSCDNLTVNSGSRMCWDTQGDGGYRCGSTLNLDTDGTWWKFIYHSN